MNRIWRNRPDTEALTPSEVFQKLRGRRNQDSIYLFDEITRYFDETHAASQVLRHYSTERQYWDEMARAAEEFASRYPSRFSELSGYFDHDDFGQITMDTPVRQAMALRYPTEPAINGIRPDVTFHDLEQELQNGGDPIDILPRNPKKPGFVHDTMVRECVYALWMEAMEISEPEFAMHWNSYLPGEWFHYPDGRTASKGPSNAKGTSGNQKSSATNTRLAHKKPAPKPKTASKAVRSKARPFAKRTPAKSEGARR